ncbi:MAG: glycosyl hydrolase [Roseibacillus sp.]|nr:glycosyl hydrolase [Roseibacillus sp.]
MPQRGSGVPLLILLALLFSGGLVRCEDLPANLLGDWSLQIKSGEAGWLSVRCEDGGPVVAMTVNVGTTRPRKGVQWAGGVLRVPLQVARRDEQSPRQIARIWWAEGTLQGEIVTTAPDGTETRDPFTGKAIAPMPPAPDLSKVRWDRPIKLFNGRDLTGWKLRRPEKLNGWSVSEGCLVNSTPKTDFSATGAYGNLRTEAVFGDCKLHIEFLVGKKRNSGVYLRGMYEAQVVDRDSPMQGIRGPGAIFNRITPARNAGRAGGEWQTYELTLVDRHITVVLNGEMVIDNLPVHGPTAGAMHTDPGVPGPLYLQGDHTSVKYRNIILTPRDH